MSIIMSSNISLSFDLSCVVSSITEFKKIETRNDKAIWTKLIAIMSNKWKLFIKYDTKIPFIRFNDAFVLYIS